MDYREKIQASIDYIEDHLSEELSLDELAKRAFLSKFHYHRVFHQLTGETVMTYIRKRRLTEAARELSESSVKIMELAMKYQFGSSESFSRAFKRIFHTSPWTFKQANLEVLQYRKLDILHKKPSVQRPMDSICRAA